MIDGANKKKTFDRAPPPSHASMPKPDFSDAPRQAPEGRPLCSANIFNLLKLRQERHLPCMANTYTQIYIHVVFAFEGRQNLIPVEHSNELQKYITGIVSAQKQKLIAINNMPDHVHILLGLQPDMALSDLVGDIKAGSSAFIKRKRWVVGRFSCRKASVPFPTRVRNSTRSSATSRTSRSTMRERHFARNTSSCWKSLESYTTSDTFSGRSMNDARPSPGGATYL
jgi:REP element-mobilizing transposase RayT